MRIPIKDSVTSFVGPADLPVTGFSWLGPDRGNLLVSLPRLARSFVTINPGRPTPMMLLTLPFPLPPPLRSRNEEKAHDLAARPILLPIGLAMPRSRLLSLDFP